MQEYLNVAYNIEFVKKVFKNPAQQFSIPTFIIVPFQVPEKL